jgi:uncharacterized protein YcfJ
MQTRMWKPLRGEPKIYGMAVLGVVCGVIGCLITMLFVGFMWSVGGAIPGYYIGEFLSKALHDGKAQRFLRWYFPSLGKSKLPSSSLKYFF